MNNQESFNIMYKHAQTMPRPSVRHNGQCLYRDINDDTHNCCLVGKLIPDELYKPEMEKKGVENLIRDFVDIRDLFFGVSTSFMSRCQTAHDVYATSNDWRKSMLYELRIIADEFNLMVPE